jgi:PAS domain S-box-containing protein
MVARSGTVRYQLNLGEGRNMTCYYVTISAVQADHEIVGYCITTSDYTAVKRGEISLRENEERFRVLVENSEDIIWLLSPEGRIKYANPGVERITGYTAQELFSITNTDLIHPQDRVLMASFVSEVTRSPEKLIRTSFRAKHKLGQWLWLEGTAINLSNRSSVNGIVMNFRDITARKHAEDERTNLMTQLIEQNNNLRQFSFIASHNLRGPVASMLGLLNLIKPGQLDTDVAEIFDMLQRSAVNLDVVIRDLARILEIRRDELQPKEWVDLRETMQTITAALQVPIEECDAEVVLNDEAISIFLTIKSYFHSILYNLISNAIKYRSAKRRLRIEITSFRTESTTGLVVRDNGTGLDLKQHGNKVFGLYQRFNLETEGKGLGLYMVRSQVNILNGTVTMESKPDEGATFTISFRETMNYGNPGTEHRTAQVHENR